MAKVPYVEIEDMPSALRDAMAGAPPLNIIKAIAHAPTAALGFTTFTDALVRHGGLDPMLRELVILRVGALSNSQYELHQHRQLARMVGLSESKIEAVQKLDDSDEFDSTEAMLLRMTDALVEGISVLVVGRCARRASSLTWSNSTVGWQV